MKTALFDFDLPASSIAHQPASRREDARLLHVTHDAFSDHHIYDIGTLLTSNDVLVFNNTRVIPARLYGMRDQVSIEILLHKQLSVPLTWRAFAKPAKRLKCGHIIHFSDGLSATVKEKHPQGDVTLTFQCSSDEVFWTLLNQLGHMPLPPYISRDEGQEAADVQRYQTVYAKHKGSVAAPTAGLHFTHDLLKQLREKGVEQHYVTLHVGGGTFLPVKTDDTRDHVMHSEYGVLSEDTANALNAAKAKGKNIVAVGTTSMRTLESATDADGIIHPFEQETDIFITPGYQFRCVDRLLTNFHLPRSSLFMLVSAFSGLTRMKVAYQHAIDSGYRFYSYGDACLLECVQEAG